MAHYGGIVMAKSEIKSGTKLICKNKKAYFDYEIETKYEAGISLLGSEVKSIRAGHVSLGESYAKFDGMERPELYLVNARISEYAWANRNNHDPLRARKLLMHKRELAKLSNALCIKGLTLIPLSMYFKNGRIKLELGLGRGKKSYDKREALKTKTVQRDMDRGE